MHVKVLPFLTDIHTMETQMLENECAENLRNGQANTNSTERSKTRKCPFCAEQIQPEAIKCRYCAEFLDGHNRAESQRSSGKWSLSTGATVIALLCLGPLALPIVWLNRRYKPATKAIISIVVLAVTIMCIYLAVTIYRQLYAQLGILEM